jgi:hypothetical protein
MTSEALFGLSVLLCFVAFGIVAGVYIWPWLVRTPRDDGFVALTIPHTFRFVGLSFLVPGVVSPTLARGFAVPAAYGDLVATVLALASIGALRLRSVLAIPLLWALNTWGTLDLLYAIYQGEIGVGVGPGSLGAAFFIPTLVVPPLLITHGLMFWLLLRRERGAAR